MNKNEKIRKLLEGEFTGEVPFSFWTHFPDIDRNPKQIAQATYDLYQQFDLDLIKTMNNGMYATEDYGAIIDYSEIKNGGIAKILETPIKNYFDWKNLPELTIFSAPAIQRELEYLKRIVELVDGEVPILMTIFSPLTTADKLSQGKILEHIRQDSEGYLRSALDKIATLTAEIAKEAIKLGASGVYFASQMASYDKLSAKDYLIYGKPYDLKVLEGSEGGWVNAIHVHGSNIMFDILRDYPVQLFNWHIWESLPEPKEAQFYTGKVIMGGLNRMDVTHNKFNELHHQIYRVITETNGKGLILTPGCVIRHPFSDETLRYIINIKKLTEQLVLEEISLSSSHL